MRLSLFAFLFLAWLPLHAAQIVITLNPDDSVQIRSALSDTAGLATRFHRITIALQTGTKADSAMILSRYAFLRHPLYRLQWGQSPISASMRSTASTVYEFDRQGGLLRSVPLSGFDSATFPQRAAYGIAVVDTVHTANAMPPSLSGLTVAGGRLYAIDNATEQLVYLDQRAGDTLWNRISFDALAPAAYRRYLGLSDSAMQRKVQAFDSLFRSEGQGSLAAVAALGQREDTLLVTLIHSYPTEFCLNNFKEVYEIVDDEIVYRAIISDPASAFNDSVDRTATMMYREQLTGKDSVRYFAQFTDYLGKCFESYKQRFPEGYSPSSQVFRNNSGAYLIRATQNRNSFRFIGVFSKSDSFLRPAGRMLGVEKGAIHKSSGNYRMSSPLAGRYPYLMDPISNVLYDLERDVQVDLPLELGNYDLSEAAMKQLRPRTELFIYDVFVQDDIARVLYVTKGQDWPRLLVYDVARRRTLSDEGLYGLSIRGRCLLKFADAGSFFVTHADGGTLQLVSLN